ncbi:heme ABC exporter ATP-binding protein CcmA [bacterium]|nr:heme ABC exporter ATP-binding protein CcmA [bacterium]
MQDGTPSLAVARDGASVGSGAPSGTALVSARGLTKSFGLLPVLRGIDLDVGRGEVVAVLGPNGTGKSTLLRLLAGVMRPGGGALRVLGAELFPGRPGPPSGVGYLGHEPLVYRDLTPRENLDFFASFLPGDRTARVERALSRARLEHAANRKTHLLSRGTLQRLAIARATLGDPELLLLDEPFTGLDPSASAHLEELVAEARRAGRSVLLVSHDLDSVPRIATRVVLLHRGRVALDVAPAPDPQALATAWREATGETPDVGDRA